MDVVLNINLVFIIYLNVGKDSTLSRCILFTVFTDATVGSRA